MRALTSLVIVALSITACGEPSVTDDSVPDPEGAMFYIESQSGFAPIEWTLRSGPFYALTTEGELISQGVVPAIFPGPLMPVYQVTQLTEGEMGQIQNIIERMGIASMTDEHDASNADFVFDLNTEVITYLDANGTHKYSVYALGIGGEAPMSEATKAFSDLRAALDTLVASRESVLYESDRIRVMAGKGLTDDEFSDLRQWPLPDDDLSDWEEVDDVWVCKVFDSAILADFGDATEATTWETPTPGEGPAELQLLVRQLHPGEDGCPSPAAVSG